MTSFKDLGLDEKIVDNLTSIGFLTPTPVQKEVIEYLNNNTTDLIALAQTGTGKTAAFGLPLLQRIDFNSRHIQGLIICPTRELCLQICNDLNTYSKPFPSKKIIPVYGGVSMEKQIRELRAGVHIVVATPGRCLDLLNKGVLKAKDVKYLVLDEADEMLNMGFQEDLNQIFEFLSKEKNTWLFSATMSQSVRKIALSYMHNPFEISLGKKNSTAENLTHIYYSVHERNRYSALKRIIDINPDIYGLIFCKTKEDTRRIAEKLMEDGYSCSPIHGDLSQFQREAVMNSFRNKTIQILVATDVAARGIDVTGITHVIHYHLPDDIESYTHRSGRTARAGKKGFSLSLINKREVGKLKAIENLIKVKFTWNSIPSGKDVCEKQLYHLIDKIESTPVNNKEIDPYMQEIQNKLGHLTQLEIIQKFISVEFNRFLDYYKDSQDINESLSGASTRESNSFGRERNFDRKDSRRGREFDRKNSEKGGFSRNSDRQNFKRFFISIGEKDAVKTGGIIKEICDQAGITSQSIGRIEIKREFSFVDVRNEDVEKIKKIMFGKFSINGVQANIEPAKERS